MGLELGTLNLESGLSPLNCPFNLRLKFLLFQLDSPQVTWQVKTTLALFLLTETYQLFQRAREAKPRAGSVSQACLKTHWAEWMDAELGGQRTRKHPWQSHIWALVWVCPTIWVLGWAWPLIEGLHRAQRGSILRLPIDQDMLISQQSPGIQGPGGHPPRLGSLAF